MSTAALDLRSTRHRPAPRVAPGGRPSDPFGVLGRTLARAYRITNLLGQGGMAAVYEARDLGRRRRCAIKMFWQEATAAEGRIAREAWIGTLGLKGVPAVFDRIEACPGSHPPFLVMEYLGGRTLAARIAIAGIGIAELLHVAWQLTFPLAEAHARGIVHRDVKPGNVLLGDDGTARLLDFGVAAARGGGPADVLAPLTSTHHILGTPAYMAPEQARRSRSVDHRADLFSVGAVLYHGITGRPMVEGMDSAEAIAHRAALAEHPPVDVQALVPALDPEVAALVRKATAFRPEDRFQTAVELRAALAACLGPEDQWPTPRVERERHRPEPETPPAGGRARRGTWEVTVRVAAAVIVAAAIAVLGAAAWRGGWGRQAPAASAAVTTAPAQRKAGAVPGRARLPGATATPAEPSLLSIPAAGRTATRGAPGRAAVFRSWSVP